MSAYILHTRGDTIPVITDITTCMSIMSQYPPDVRGMKKKMLLNPMRRMREYMNVLFFPIFLVIHGVIATPAMFATSPTAKKIPA